MQSRYPYKPSENELTTFQQKISWLFDGLSLSASVAVNKQILEVIPTPGNDAILVVYQINARYNTYARDSAFRRIN